MNIIDEIMQNPEALCFCLAYCVVIFGAVILVTIEIIESFRR